ncbi:MAG: hypothetical protein M3463_05215, partial [Verrucomicrobiota bacterium]|nr:hypothetical protein [Verrucomicrobiota bacterium]
MKGSHWIRMVVVMVGISTGVAWRSDAAPEDKTGKAPTITFDWPAELTDNFFTVRGLTEKEGVGSKGGRESQKLTTAVPDGRYELRVGEVSLPFVVLGGEIKATPDPAVGIRFDRGTNTFHFDTTTLQVVFNGFAMPVQIVNAGGKLNAEGKTGAAVKVVPSEYRLNYTSGTAKVLAGREGRVSLAEPAPGLTTDGSKVVLAPREFQFEPGAAGFEWQIVRGQEGAQTTAGTRKLLPGKYEVSVRPPRGKARRVPFHVTNDFRLGLQPGGPFLELLALGESGASTAGETAALAISIPDGRALMQARLEKEAAEKRAHDVFVAASETAPWKRDFTFTDYLQLYDFPEELLSYSLEFPPGKVRAAGLQLTALHGQRAQAAPFQLTEVQEHDGFLQRAVLHFRSDLPKTATRHFRLTSAAPPAGMAPVTRVEVAERQGEAAVLRSSRLRVKVPAGRRELSPPLPLSALPAPMLAIARPDPPGAWRGSGKLIAPDALTVRLVAAQTEVEGPLLARHRVTYTFTNGASYSVALTLRHNDSHVTLDEVISGLEPRDEAYFRFDLTPGFDPNQRQVMSNGGYQMYSGAFDRALSAEGQLPYQLGLNTPNSLGVMRATAFWSDDAQEAMLLALNRLRDWKT